MKFLLQYYDCLIYGSLVLSLIYMILKLQQKNRELKSLKKRMSIKHKLLHSMKSAESLESILMELLLSINSIISVASFAVYIYEDKEDRLELKALRQASEGEDKINPSYSGLLPYKKEVFFLPSHLSKDIIPKFSSIKTEGEIPLLFAPIDDKALIVLGPIKTISIENLQSIDELINVFEPILSLSLKMEILEKENICIKASQKVTTNKLSIFSDFNNLIEMVIKNSIKDTGAQGGMLITSDSTYKIEKIVEEDENIKEWIVKDINIPVIFDELIDREGYRIISKKDKEFYRIPPYFIVNNVEAFLAVKIISGSFKCILVIWYNTILNLNEYQMKILQIMIKKLQQVFYNYINFKELSSSYIEIMKMISKLAEEKK